MDGIAVFPGQILASADGEKVFVIGIVQQRGMTTSVHRLDGRRAMGRSRSRPQGDWGDCEPVRGLGRHQRRPSTLFVAGSVGGFRHGVAAYATKDGVKFWTLGTSRSSWSWPMIVPSQISDIVFLADQNHDDYLITAIDAATGRELWRSTYAEARRDHYSIEMAVPADGSRVFVTGFPAIYCPRCPASATIALDAVDGRLVWAHAPE